MGNPDVTVLIATRNRADHLTPAPETILASARPAPFEVEMVLVERVDRHDT